jgi:hypothetical protein
MNLDLRNTVWLEYMCMDPLNLHSTLWCTQSYFDWVSRNGPSIRSMVHEAKTLALLQHRITKGNPDPISDTTIAVVVALVLTKALIGDFKTAITHVEGLARMVSMRGGVRAFQGNAQLQIKVCRADLCVAVSFGRPPLFFSSTDLDLGRILAATDDERWALPRELSTLPIDMKIADLWTDLKCFTVLANLAFQTDRKLDPVIFQMMLTNVMYQAVLLDMDSPPAVRALQLSVLAFGATVFLQAHGVKTRLKHLARQLREALCSLDYDEQDVLSEIKLWSLFVTGISAVTDEDDDWLLPLLRSQIQQNSASSWMEARRTLKEFLWVDSIHDREGKELYNRALIGSTSVCSINKHANSKDETNQTSLLDLIKSSSRTT